MNRFVPRFLESLLGRSNVSVWVFLFALVFTVSCSTKERSIRAPVPVPETFSQAGKVPLPDEWWLSFNDPTLHLLVARAVDANLSLRTAWDRLAQVTAIARREGAPLWPSLDGAADVSQTATRSEVKTKNGSRRATDHRTEFGLGLIAQYELDLWGRIRSTRDAAVLDARASREELRAAAITLSAQVAATWYQLIEQYGQIELLRQQLKTNEEVLELVTLRFRRGQTGAADVLQQRQLVEARRGDIVDAESRAATLAHQLAILLGQPPRASVAEPGKELVQLPELPATGLPAALVQRRPDVRRAYYDVLAADRRVAAAIADRFPRITVVAAADTSAEKIRDLFDDWMATLAANLVAPIFDAGSRSAEVDRSRAVVSERLHQYGQTILDSLGEVEDALSQEQQQTELIASLAKQITLSAQVIERTRDSYLNGALDYLRVLAALTSHQNLQRTYLEAQRQRIEFRIDLCRALGGGWEMEQPKLANLQWETRKKERP